MAYCWRAMWWCGMVKPPKELLSQRHSSLPAVVFLALTLFAAEVSARRFLLAPAAIMYGLAGMRRDVGPSYNTCSREQINT